ncbi:MAG: Bug family tripartite tricarboxylate transporter substrate binding protein [Pigmentiphaga sp.]|uniref:Bug family tripartite tricarboxylate transporter substrate binding protein n=1 Tax=Pigmentiphaga sp. TaxID=1977564 RepID=UPI003B538401
MKTTNPTRRSILAMGIAVASTSVLGQGAWPTKPITMVIGIPPGLPADVFARLYADKLSKALGQPVIVDNKPGAGGNIAQNAVAKAAPDGHTLLYSVSNSFVTNPHIYAKLPFNPQTDFAAVGSTVEATAYLIVSNDFPAKSLQEMINLVQANPGKHMYASYGIGGFPHLVVELISAQGKLNMEHVPYKAGPLPDVVAGRVPILVEPAGTALPYIKDGKVRALGYYGGKRNPETPDVPLIQEVIKDAYSPTFHGVWAPSGTPRNVVQRLGEEIAKVNRDPEIIEKLRSFAAEPITMSPAQIDATVRRESERWSKVIRDKNIKLD